MPLCIFPLVVPVWPCDPIVDCGLSWPACENTRGAVPSVRTLESKMMPRFLLDMLILLLTVLRTKVQFACPLHFSSTYSPNPRHSWVSARENYPEVERYIIRSDKRAGTISILHRFRRTVDPAVARSRG